MANTIKPKRSNTANKVPNTSELISGELGVNMADKKVYINNGTAVVQVGAGNLSGLSDVTITTPSSGQSLSWNGTAWVNSNAGAGDVVGAASSTDNAITRFDGTTGKVIQNSIVTIDDNGNIAGLNSFTFDTTPTTPPTTEGSLYWDSADGNQTLSLVMAGGNATQQIGEEFYYRIKASAPITNGQVVMFTGTVGASGALTGAPATGLTAATASYIMGIATQDMATNDWGYVTSFGLVRNINTSAFTAGDILYFNPSVTGGLTTTIPTAPNAKVQVCAVIYSSATVGSLFVRPSFGGILGQYEGDVNFTSTVAGNLIRRNAGNTAWENVATIPNTNLANSSITINGSAISLGGTVSVGTVTSVAMTVPTGLSIAGTPITSTGTLAITYTAGYAIPTTASQTNWDTAFTDRLKWDGGATGLVAATGRTSLGATTVGGNLFTLTNPTAITFLRINADNTVSALDAATFRTAIGAGTSSTTGTVTSVSGTAPISVATGTTTPAITIAQATTTTSGYLSSTDWNTFNGKQAAGSYVTVGGALGTPSSGTLTNCTFPTLNQNTTGTSAGLSGTPAITVGAIGCTTITASGAITSTGNVTAFFSDDRLKTRHGKIENALEKLQTLDGFYYTPNEVAQAFGYEAIQDVGVSAQSVQAIMPEIVVPAPIDENYLTVRYEKLVPLLIEAIKELKAEVNELKRNNKNG